MKNILKIAVLLMIVLSTSLSFAQNVEVQQKQNLGITDNGGPLIDNIKGEIVFESITKEGMVMQVGLANIEPGSPLDVFIFDITGKKILESHLYISDARLIHGIDTTKMSEGIYIITVRNNNRQSSKKIYNI